MPSGPAGFGHLAATPALDHLLDHPRLALEDAPVIRSRGVDDLAATAEEGVAEFEDAQIGPGSRALPDDRQQRLFRRPIRVRLRQDQGRRGGRARYPCMAMDEQMRAPGVGQIASEVQELYDIATFRRDPAGARFDNVVKT